MRFYCMNCGCQAVIAEKQELTRWRCDTCQASASIRMFEMLSNCPRLDQAVLPSLTATSGIRAPRHCFHCGSGLAELPQAHRRDMSLNLACPRCGSDYRPISSYLFVEMAEFHAPALTV